VSKARWLMLPALLATSVTSAAAVTAQEIRDLLPLTGFERMGDDATEALLSDVSQLAQLAGTKRQCVAGVLSRTIDEMMVKGLGTRLGDDDHQYLQRWQTFYSSPGGRWLVAKSRQSSHGTAFPAGVEEHPNALVRSQVSEFMASGAYQVLVDGLTEMLEMPDDLLASMSGRVHEQCGITIDSNEFS